MARDQRQVQGPRWGARAEVARHRGLEAQCGAGLQLGQVFLGRLRYRLRHYATDRQVVNV